MRNSGTMRALVAVAAALAAGCDAGGPPEMSEVRSCLEAAKLKVESFSESDKKVSEGVFATTDLSTGERGRFTFAVAAIVKSEQTVDEFQRDTKRFSETLSVGEQKLEIDSGTEDRYVWVVGGAKQDDSYDAARACVAP